MKTLSACATLAMSLVCTVHVEAAWSPVFPESHSASGFEVRFVDARFGYAATPYEAKPIYATANAGLSWTPLDYGPQMKIASLHFPRTAMTGYALGKDSVTLLKTTDGGATWTRWRSDYPLTQLQFVNDSTAFAISGGRLLRSFNGAATWQEGFPPVSFAGYGGVRLFFGNENLGLLSMYDSTTKAGRLFKTSTAGGSWMEIPGAPYLREFSFLDPDTGFATGWLGADSLGFAWDRVFRTTDGGITWSIALSAPQSTFSWLLSWWTLSGQVALSGSVAYVLENGWTNMGTGNARILKTIDGGTTWTVEFQNGSGKLYSLQFPEAHVGFATGTTGIGGALYKYVAPSPAP